MRIEASNVYYRNDSIANNQAKKSVMLTEYTDVLTAVNKGKLTVEGVTLELSDAVRNAIKEASDQQFKDSQTVSMMNATIHNANVAKQQGSALESAVKDQARALEIARRISKGGKVPPQDEWMLMKYSPQMYQMAKMAAMMAEEHKKYDSVLDGDSKEDKEFDADEGKIDTKYHVQVEVSLGENPVVESVSEVAVTS